MPEHPIPSRAIFFLATAGFASASTSRICDSLLPQIADQFHSSTGDAAWTITAYVLTYGIFQALFGPAGDRFGKYRVVLAASAASILTTGMCALATSLPMLAIMRLASGATAAALIPLSIAWIGDVVDYRKRQSVLARFMTGQLTGLIFGQAAGGAISQYFGWRMAFVAVAMLYVVAAIGLGFELKRNPLAQTRRTGPHIGLVQAWIAMLLLLRRWRVRMVLLGIFIEGFAMFGPFAFAGTTLHERFGIGLDKVGLVLAIYGLGGLLYTVLVDKMLKALGEPGISVLGGAALGVAFLLVSLTPSLWIAGLACGIVGFGFYALHATLQTHATQMAPDARGGAIALFASLFFMGQSVGVAMAAKIVDHFGSLPPFVAGAIMLPLLGWWFSRQIPQFRVGEVQDNANQRDGLETL